MRLAITKRQALRLCLRLLSLFILAYICRNIHHRSYPTKQKKGPYVREPWVRQPWENEPMSEIFSRPRYRQEPPWGQLEYNQTNRLDKPVARYCKTVMCWPREGGVIIADRVSNVELDFLNLSRVEAAQRSDNQTQEDAFCHELRKIGGRWWENQDDWEDTIVTQYGRSSWRQRQVLHLCWPASGGVWLLRRHSIYTGNPYLKQIHYAKTMEERCKFIELGGGGFFANPNDSVFVKPLLDSLGVNEVEDYQSLDPFMLKTGPYPYDSYKY